MAGPRRASAGGVRDFVLGASLLNAQGELLHFGGQVMKNVAGFDISRLLCGSLGVLGLIAQVSLKVLPQPREEVSLRFAADAAQALALFNRWRAQPLPISATAWQAGVATLRLSGAPSALRAARASTRRAMYDGRRWQHKPGGAVCAIQTHLAFFGDSQQAERLWRLSLPATAPLDISGGDVLEWGGALRWLRSDAQPSAIRGMAEKLGGSATLWRGDARYAHVPSARAAQSRTASAPKAAIRSARHLQSRPAGRGPVTMETHLADWIKNTPTGAMEAGRVHPAQPACIADFATRPVRLISCSAMNSTAHVGASIKSCRCLLEGAMPSATTQLHLDRCLTCTNCETTCPSGVRYGRLVEIGRAVVEERVARPLTQRWSRDLLRFALTRRWLFAPVVRLGRALRPLLPARLRSKLAPLRAAGAWPQRAHARKVLLLRGCVQPTLMPSIDAATARVLDRVGIEVVVAENSGCCGAIDLHLSATGQGAGARARNIDAWWPYLQPRRKRAQRRS